MSLKNTLLFYHCNRKNITSNQVEKNHLNLISFSYSFLNAGTFLKGGIEKSLV